MMKTLILTYALVLGFIAFAPSAQAMDPIDQQPVADLRTALKSSGQVRIAQGYQNYVAKNGQGQSAPSAAILMLTTNKNTHEWTITVVYDKTIGSAVLIGTDLRDQPDGHQSLPTFNRVQAGTVLNAMNARGSGYYDDEAQKLIQQGGCKKLFTGKVSFALASALVTASAYNQYKIDTNLLKLNVNGKDVQIPQGELRKIMRGRVEELKGQLAQLQNNNANPDEIAQTKELLQKYQAQASEVTPPNFANMKPVFMDLFAATNGEFHVLVVDQYGVCVEIASGTDFGPNLEPH